MKTTVKYFISIITLAVLILTGFLLVGTQNNIISTIFDKDNNVWVLISQIPFISLYLYTICFLFVMCFTEYNDKIISQTFKEFKESLIFFFIAKIVIDIIFFFVSKSSHIIISMNYWFPSCLLLIASFIYLIIKHKVIKRRPTKSVVIFCSVAVILISAIIVIYILKMLYFHNAMDYYNRKYIYDNTTDVFIVIRSKIEIINLYTILLLYAFLWLLFMSIFKTSYVPNKQTPVPTYIFRVLIAFICYFIYFIVFLYFAPYGPYAGCRGSGYYSEYTSGDKDFNIAYENVVHYRKKSIDGSIYVAYVYPTFKLKYGNDILLNYNFLFPIREDKDILNIEGTSCYQYDNKIIAYIDDNGRAHAIPVEEIKNQPESVELTYALEQLNIEGNFEFFEYGYEYLLKYDRDFIIEIIKDYADDGKFNGKNSYDHISSKYKIDFAQKVLKKI